MNCVIVTNVIIDDIIDTVKKSAGNIIFFIINDEGGYSIIK